VNVDLTLLKGVGKRGNVYSGRSKERRRQSHVRIHVLSCVVHYIRIDSPPLFLFCYLTGRFGLKDSVNTNSHGHVI